MEEKKKELIKKIDQLKPIDLLMIQNVADVLITRDKIETWKRSAMAEFNVREFTRSSRIWILEQYKVFHRE